MLMTPLFGKIELNTGFFDTLDPSWPAKTEHDFTKPNKWFEREIISE